MERVILSSSWLKGNNSSPSFLPLTDETIQHHLVLANDPSLALINDEDLRQNEYITRRLLLGLKYSINVRAILLMDIELTDRDNAAVLGSVLRRNRSIKKLLLRDNFISDVGMKVLARTLYPSCSTSIRVLDLSHNFIGDEGAKELARLLEGVAVSTTCKLRKLSLACNHIGSAGALCLARALPRASRHLRILNLNNNYIGEAAAREVVTRLATLRYNVQVTIAGDNNHVHKDTEKALVKVCRIIRQKMGVRELTRKVELWFLEQSRLLCCSLCSVDDDGGRRIDSRRTFGAIEASDSFPELEESIRMDQSTIQHTAAHYIVTDATKKTTVRSCRCLTWRL